MLTVSVVPDYANAIMDAERDGFKGLSDHEIVADPEAAALAQQFALTVRVYALLPRYQVIYTIADPTISVSSL